MAWEIFGKGSSVDYKPQHNLARAVTPFAAFLARLKQAIAEPDKRTFNELLEKHALGNDGIVCIHGKDEPCAKPAPRG